MLNFVWLSTQNIILITVTNSSINSQMLVVITM